MKLLVTGGAGFIGSAVVRQAVAQGHEVINPVYYTHHPAHET
jgi:dTDP-glucose 4,6-dehydratase